MNPSVNIRDYYANKCIFVTGGCGFIGKVLVENLLRDCPDVQKIYLLIRPKRKQDPQERLTQMLNIPLFDRLKREYPENLNKVIAIPGDVAELNLGLSDEHRRILQENVSIVFHSAASVRFDNPLAEAIILNTRGTREVLKLVETMPKLEVFLHVSTIYCNADHLVIEEKLYPPRANWEKFIEMVEHMDSHLIDVCTPKCIDRLPNTYTFSKALAEDIVNDLCTGKIPAVILRPSIVLSTLKSPVAGWIDNFNGPIGIFVGFGKGILRIVYAEAENLVDFIPADTVTKSMMLAAWKKAITPDLHEKYKVAVYNCSSQNYVKSTIMESFQIVRDLNIPFSNIIWQPSYDFCTNWYIYCVKFLLYQIIPSVLIDCLLRLGGKKPRLMKIQRKIFVATKSFVYFLLTVWTIKNDNFRALLDEVDPKDEEFSFRLSEVNKMEATKNLILGTRRYLLKEDNATLEKDILHARRIARIAIVTRYLRFIVLVYLCYKVGIFHRILDFFLGIYA